MNIQPLKPLSLKEQCVAQLEELILSGELQIGQRLPAERILAARLNISRPVLHEALVDLAAKGLVTIAPRHGVKINDYRLNGSVAMLASLLAHQKGRLDPAMQQSLMDMRILLETETARLAALHRTTEQIHALQKILEEEMKSDCQDVATLTRLDFEFHLQIALASGNLVYPLIVNSFRQVYTNLTGAFFGKYASCPILQEVLEFHQQLVRAIQTSNASLAANLMQQMLQHGESLLKQSEETNLNPVDAKIFA
jgi:DNA-binding FadR family transcriptional regulator